MAMLFHQDFNLKAHRKSSMAARGGVGDASSGARADSPAPPAERVRIYQEELEKVMSATGLRQKA